MPTKQTLVLTMSMVLFLPATISLAQSGDRTETDSTWIGVITSDATNVRCGANESYYTVATANRGDLVRVCGKRQDWMKIDTSGSVFENIVGYVKYPANETLLFEVIGNTGVVRGDLEVLARNTESEELYRSWRPILQLRGGDRVGVVRSIVTEPGTLHRDAYVVHTVKMPSNATCWVNASNVARATPDQVALFNGVNSTDSSETIAEVAKENMNNTESVVLTETGVDGDSVSVELEPLTLVELEAAWKKIAAEPVMGAEVTPLKDMYAELLLENGDDLVVEQIAGGRMKQLEVWAGLQNQRVRIEALRTSMVERSDEVQNFRSVMSLYGNYALAGRLALSNTFDGRLRPFMYRIQDVNSGRTLGYLTENEDWGLPNLVGQTIGLVGENRWNPNWSVYVVEAERFDILSPSTATVTPDIQ